MAAGQTTSLDDWKKRKENAIAEKAALDAEKELVEARKALEAAKAPVDPAKKRLEEQLAVLKEAESLSNAKLAAFKATLGDVPSSSIAGDITVGAKAGVAESALLASRAIEEAADTITSRLTSIPAIIVLYPAKEVPDFQALRSYRAQIEPVDAAFKKAWDDSKAADQSDPQLPPAPQRTVFPAAAAAGLSLEALTKLLGYFKSEYTVGGVDVTQDDSLLLHALAGSLAKKTGLTVQLPSIYIREAENSLLGEIQNLSEEKSNSLAKAVEHEQRTLDLTAQADAEANPTIQADLRQKAESRTEAAKSLRAAASAYDAFFDKLTTADDKGLIPLTQVLRDNSIMKALEGGAALLVVKIQASGGSYYTQKNLWTFFGGVPIFHMGGVVTSFVLFDGPTGKVLSAGVVPIHGGFFRARKVESALAPGKRAGWLSRFFNRDPNIGSNGAAGVGQQLTPAQYPQGS